MEQEYKRRLLCDAWWDNWTGYKLRAEAGLCRVARAVEREHYDRYASESKLLTENTLEKETNTDG